MEILEKQDTLDSFYVWQLNQILNLKNQKPMNEKFLSQITEYLWIQTEQFAA